MSVLKTDHYKKFMHNAGYPLRPEVFYYTHRRGGPHYMPFNMSEVLSELLSQMADDMDGVAWSFLEANDQLMNTGYRQACQQTDNVTVRQIPEGKWWMDGEPAFSVRAPSAVASWPEPMLLWLHFPIKVATVALTKPQDLPDLIGELACDEQRAIAEEVLEKVEVMTPTITVDREKYYNTCLRRAKRVVDLLGDPSRAMEVGMRGVSCMAQHKIALQACKEAGITTTSNDWLAYMLGLKPVGSMGHEHIMRFMGDREAFAAAIDRCGKNVAFLVDTYDTLRSGIPTAFELMAERGFNGAIRFDSGNILKQVRFAVDMANMMGLQPTLILMDGITSNKIVKFEKLREELEWPAERWVYGLGGYLVNGNLKIRRDVDQAVYKLCESDGVPTMKFADAPNSSKASMPGDPMVAGAGYARYIVQADEPLPASWKLVTDNPKNDGLTHTQAYNIHNKKAGVPPKVYASPYTKALVEGLEAQKNAVIGGY
tara:strand:+ start:839 stop:2290 length:1452 start_codon:yes stop_codon:yes gene_type:complete